MSQRALYRFGTAFSLQHHVWRFPFRRARWFSDGCVGSKLAPRATRSDCGMKPSPFSIQGRHGLSEFFWIMAAKTLKNPYRLQTVAFSQRHVHLHSQAWTWVNTNSNLRDNAWWKWFKFKARWRLARLFLAKSVLHITWCSQYPCNTVRRTVCWLLKETDF